MCPARRLGGDVDPASPDDAGQLEFVVEQLGIGRPADVGVGTHHREAVGLVVDRLPVPDLGNIHVSPGQPLSHREGTLEVLLEGQEVPDLGRHRDRSHQRRHRQVNHRLLRRRLHQPPNQVESRLAAVDQRDHRRQGRMPTTVHPLLGSAQVQHTAPVVDDHRHPFGPDSGTNRCQLHRSPIIAWSRDVKGLPSRPPWSITRRPVCITASAQGHRDGDTGSRPAPAESLPRSPAAGIDRVCR